MKCSRTQCLHQRFCVLVRALETCKWLERAAVHRWCTTQAPAGPTARLLHGWDALGGLLLQLVAVHRTSIPDAHVRNALDALIASTLSMLLRRERIQDR